MTREMLAVQKLRLGLSGLAILSIAQALVAVVGLSNIRAAQSEFSDKSFPLMAKLNDVSAASAEIAQQSLRFVESTSPEEVSEISFNIERIDDEMMRSYQEVVSLDTSLRHSNLVASIDAVRELNEDLRVLRLERFSLEDSLANAKAEVQVALKNLLSETEVARDTASLSLSDPTQNVVEINTFRRFFQIHQLVEKISARLGELTYARGVPEVRELEEIVALHTRDLHKSVTRLSDGSARARTVLRMVELDDVLVQSNLFDKRVNIERGLAHEQTKQVALAFQVAFLRKTAQEIAYQQEQATKVLDDHLKSLTAQTSHVLTLLSIACVIGILAMIIFVIERQIARRLSLVGQNASRIEAGDYSEQPEFSGADEIAALGRSVDRLRVVSDQKTQLHEELRQASNDAKQAAKLKSDFLSMMSHEIRTPLNAILGLFELLMRSDLPAKQMKRVEAGHRAAGNLFKTLSDVLDASRLEAGKMDRKIEKVYLGDLADYFEVFAHALNKRYSKKLKVIIENSHPDELYLHTDDKKIRQILTNLLDNAVRFTDDGSITVGITHDTRDGCMRISVADTGVGIRPEELRTIFDSFRQARSGISREAGGSGLGLTICKELAELLGGTLTVTSTWSVGSTFELTLPLTPKEMEHAA